MGRHQSTPSIQISYQKFHAAVYRKVCGAVCHEACTSGRSRIYQISGVNPKIFGQFPPKTAGKRNNWAKGGDTHALDFYCTLVSAQSEVALTVSSKALNDIFERIAVEASRLAHEPLMLLKSFPNTNHLNPPMCTVVWYKDQDLMFSEQGWDLCAKAFSKYIYSCLPASERRSARRFIYVKVPIYQLLS